VPSDPVALVILLSLTLTPPTEGRSQASVDRLSGVGGLECFQSSPFLPLLLLALNASSDRQRIYWSASAKRCSIVAAGLTSLT
jgi:hypothetical protein